MRWYVVVFNVVMLLLCFYFLTLGFKIIALDPMNAVLGVILGIIGFGGASFSMGNLLQEMI